MEKRIEKLENELQKFKKSYLEINLTTIFFNSMIRMLILHLSQIDKNFLNVADKYIQLSTEGIMDYINKTCPEQAKEFCSTFVNNLQKEYLKLLEDINEAKKDSSN